MMILVRKMTMRMVIEITGMMMIKMISNISKRSNFDGDNNSNVNGE